jgi:hypothetical protein
MYRLLCLVLLAAALLAVPGRETSAADKDSVIHLFNGKDLTGFYTWLKGQGKNNDPEKVFTVHDGMIHISGKVFGGLITEKEYDNYHLVTEFKWGEKTYAPREDKARDSGILLHCVGEDGAAGGVWMESIECQMIEGGTGDIILVKGKGTAPSLKAHMTKKEVGTEKKRIENYWDPKGEEMTLTGGRLNWYGRSPEWKDVKGFRGKEDVEKPVGEWNTLECICDGGKLTYILNGKEVNRGVGSLTRGKLLFQSEGAELFFRKIDLKPLGGAK